MTTDHCSPETALQAILLMLGFLLLCLAASWVSIKILNWRNKPRSQFHLQAVDAKKYQIEPGDAFM